MTSGSFNRSNPSHLWARLFLIFFVICLNASHSAAIPVSEYHQNLQRAITALDTLAQIDEDESTADYEHRLTETSTAVRQTVPEKQSVEFGDSTCIVDNTWLHKKLDEFEADSESNRQVIRQQLIESLKAVEERVTEFENATSVTALSKAEANQKLVHILSRPEYASSSKQGAFLTRLVDRFIRWIAGLFPQRSPLASSHGSPFILLAQIVVVLLAVAVIVYVVIKLITHFGTRSNKGTAKKKKEPRIVLGEQLAPDASSTDLLAEAEALARKGEIRAAIRKTYIALLVELGDRKVISLAQHKTNRDYLRSVSHVPNLYNNMGGLTESFERHWYGFAESSATDWQDFRSAYLAALRATE